MTSHLAISQQITVLHEFEEWFNNPLGAIFDSLKEGIAAYEATLRSAQLLHLLNEIADGIISPEEAQRLALELRNDGNHE